jgi:hypothetical protein
VLLKEVLPISQDVSTSAIRQRVRQTAERLEDELGEERDIFMMAASETWNELPEPATPLIVGIDAQAANVFYALGGVQVLQWSDAAFFYAPIGSGLRPHHFAQRIELKEKVSSMVTERFQIHSSLKAEAQCSITWPLPPCMESGDGSRQFVCAGPNASALLSKAL